MKKLISIVASLALIILPLATTTTTITTPTETIAANDETGLISVGSVDGKYGDYVSVPVYLEKNPGIIATSITVGYDTNYLELLSVDDNQLFSGATFTPSGKMTINPFRLTWEDALATENYTDTGILAYLNFRITDYGYWNNDCELTVNVEAENTFDKDINEVPFETGNGSVYIYALTTSMSSETTTRTETTTTTMTYPIESTTEATTTTESYTYPPTSTTTTTTTTMTYAESTTEATTTTESYTYPPTSTTTTTTTTMTYAEETTTTTTTTMTYAESTTEATTTTEIDSEPETTTTTTIAETTTITEPEETTTTTSYIFCDSVAELRDMAKKDYKAKTGIYPEYATSSVQENGTVIIDLYDENDNYLATYTVDKTTGFGITSDGNGVNLPETGLDATTKNLVIGGAVLMILGGSYILFTARKKEEE